MPFWHGGCLKPPISPSLANASAGGIAATEQTKTMRKYSKTVGALAAASTLVAGNAMAELEGEVHVGYTNMYEFRFVDFGNDLVSAGVDLAWDAGPIGLSAGAWYGSFDGPNSIQTLNNTAFGTQVNNDELDLYFAANYEIGGLTLELGHISYVFPDIAGADTNEIYVGAAYDFDFGLSLGSTYYYDYDRLDGWYWDTNIGYAWEINECVALELGAGVAFANGHGGQGNANPFYAGYSGATANGLQGWYLTAALPWEFREGVTLTPFVKYTDADSDLATDFYGNGGDEYFIAGASLALSF